MQILAISGSLRTNSSNTNLLRAATALAPKGVEISLWEGLGDLPHFNPDIDDLAVPQAVKLWRSKLKTADGVVFSVPEYAHGVPGVLKNALDWIVGSGELVDKPVTLFNAAPRGTYAQASLTETLTVMSAKVMSDASVTLQLLGKTVSADEINAQPGMSAALRSAIELFVLAVDANCPTGARSSCPKTEGILESSLYVTDVARSIQFYLKIFGFQVISNFGDRGCALEAGNRQVLLLFKKGGSREMQSPHDGGGELHLAFAIRAAELAKWEAWLADSGITVEERRTWEFGGQSIYFRDPDRHLVEIATPGVWSIY